MMSAFAQLRGFATSARLAAVSITHTVYDVVLWFMALCGLAMWLAIAMHAYGTDDQSRPSLDNDDEPIPSTELRQAAETGFAARQI
jgi:hypothetical protein